MFRSDAFTILSDRVEQGKYTARASDPYHMVSDYVSRNAAVDPVIEFKFSINGRDDELPYGVNHKADISPGSDGTVEINVIFGQRSTPETGEASEHSLPANTRVRFRVDFSEVLRSFNEKGYYDDILGTRIFKDDFKGLFIAGDTYPLNWDFENIPANPDLKMEDPDGDGLYEKELIFNVYDPSAHTSSEWGLSNDITSYPQFESKSVLLNAIYNMTLDEMIMLMEEDGTFRTGKEWAGVWTRDISYATLLSLAYLDPARCRASLMSKVSDGRIIQDTGTGGAWPVSSDRVVWVLAAWEIYKYTGDREWLQQAFAITATSMEADRKTITDPATGLIRGESSFLDWRKQTYPLWMEPADIYYSLNLGTNAAYCQALKVMGMMAGELGEEDRWSEQSANLSDNINRLLWQENKGYYSQYMYGRLFRSLSPRAEGLGEAFTVLFNIAGDSRKQKVLQNTPVTPFGITCIYPQIPGIPPYHNNGIWPFVEAFWTLANAGEKRSDAVASGLASIIRPAALFLTNKENFVAENGDFAGTEINSDRQLWSVAAMLAMYHRVLFGISFGPDSMKFSPVIPKSYNSIYSLRNYRYRNGTYDIFVKGHGDDISSFVIDGKETARHSVPDSMTGKHTIEIVMNGKSDHGPSMTVTSYTAPDTPVLSANNGKLQWNPVSNAKEYMVFVNGNEMATTSGTSADMRLTDEVAEYQVMTIDSSGTGSFLSNPAEYVPDQLKTVIEAEDYSANAGKDIKGYSGRGYVRFTTKNNKDLIIKINAKEGDYSLTMRYANGTGPVNTDNNCGIRSLYVNGSFAGSLVFPQRGNDEWSDWGMTCPERIALKDGENKLTIKYEDFNLNMDGDINEFLLDYILLEKVPPE